MTSNRKMKTLEEIERNRERFEFLKFKLQGAAPGSDVDKLLSFFDFCLEDITRLTEILKEWEISNLEHLDSTLMKGRAAILQAKNLKEALARKKRAQARLAEAEEQIAREFTAIFQRRTDD